VRLLRRTVDISDDYDGPKVRTVVDGKRMFTPMIIVFVAIGMTDLLFAIDSIPAIFGITQNPFIVFTANIFALMGLRQLYFLLGDLLDRLKYLHYGIAFILAFIGVKLISTRCTRTSCRSSTAASTSTGRPRSRRGCRSASSSSRWSWRRCEPHGLAERRAGRRRRPSTASGRRAR
jgi:TerC family integral membrane protein